ncbi:MAG: SsrA-binding protein SmpB [Planctomycetota bacterium]|nr:SsrA-binding protein SmpB [Planctomycetota bacterium]
MARKRSTSRSKEPPSDKIVLATNRRARRDYAIHDSIEAGLVLLGSEVKSLRGSTPTLREGYARFRGEALWLFGIHIGPLPQASYQNHEPDRPRKCLLKKRELRKLKHALEAKGMTLVPLSLYFLKSRVKVELGLAKGRAKGDRRAADREKQDRKRIREATL